MKNVIGQPARGKDFFPRPTEIKKISRSLSSGNHLQIAAPRRVGKTSILMYFVDNKHEHFEYVYLDVEASTSENEFYKKLYESILRSDALTKSAKIISQLKSSGNTFLKRIKSFSVKDGKIELLENANLNFFDEFCNLIKGLEFDKKKLVVLIDEFPYAINNLIKGQDSEAARNLLKSKRTIRQDPSLNRKVQFVYTGSISLNATVEKIGASELVNDIDSISVDALSAEEAKEFLQLLAKEDNVILAEQDLNYILEKVIWLIPFHLQLFIKELIEILLAQKKAVVTNELIDKAFNEIIDFRNNNYFEHYSSRLKKLFKDFDYQFASDVLNHTAENAQITKYEIINYAAKYNLEKEYQKIIRNLEYDGYIHSDITGKTFQFNSTILKMWWRKYAN